MAKKTDSTSKPTVSEKPAKAAPKKKVVAKATKAPAAKNSKKPAAKTAKASKPAATAYTRDDVALRAYFISEKRQAHGLPGNEHLDWLEAERQLAAESGKRRKTQKA